MLRGNIVTGVALLLISIVVVGYAASEILGAITPESGSLGENVKIQVQNKFPTVFTLLILVAIVAVIMVVLRAFGAI